MSVARFGARGDALAPHGATAFDVDAEPPDFEQLERIPEGHAAHVGDGVFFRLACGQEHMAVFSLDGYVREVPFGPAGGVEKEGDAEFAVEGL